MTGPTVAPERAPWVTPLAVAVGGALGALVRWGVGEVLPPTVGAGLPWATLVVNVVGAFLLGVLIARQPSTLIRAGLGTGALGAFTTYSAFAVETVELANGRPLAALVHVVVMLVLGLAAARVGLTAGRGGKST